MKPKKTTYFGNIVLQAKDESEDWRSFLHCTDTKNRWWELRGYGKTPGQAAEDVWKAYQSGEKNWTHYGYITPTPE